MMKLSDLPNISTVNEEKLIKAGIDTPEKLKRLGSKKAWMKVRALSDSETCLNMLYGLEGAIREIKKKELTVKVKEELKVYYNEIINNN